MSVNLSLLVKLLLEIGVQIVAHPKPPNVIFKKIDEGGG